MISTRSTSFTDHPARSKAWRTAGTGPMPNMPGGSGVGKRQGAEPKEFHHIHFHEGLPCRRRARGHHSLRLRPDDAGSPEHARPWRGCRSGREPTPSQQGMGRPMPENMMRMHRQMMQGQRRQGQHGMIHQQSTANGQPPSRDRMRSGPSRRSCGFWWPIRTRTGRQHRGPSRAPDRHERGHAPCDRR